MAEADIYLNGVYGKKSGTYTYTIFDANGGTAGSGGEDKMQGYRRDGSTQILVADPTLSGYSFAGWFTQRSGGTRVTTLDSSTAGVTLYAQYSSTALAAGPAERSWRAATAPPRSSPRAP